MKEKQKHIFVKKTECKCNYLSRPQVILIKILLGWNNGKRCPRNKVETLLLIMSIKLKKNYCTITNQIERVKGENKEKERERKKRLSVQMAFRILIIQNEK